MSKSLLNTANGSTVEQLTDLALEVVAGGAEHPGIEALNARHERQLARIDQGVQAGTLSAEDAAELIASEQSLGELTNSWVEQNGGVLTEQQFHDINQGYRELNANIFAAKHKS